MHRLVARAKPYVICCGDSLDLSLSLEAQKRDRGLEDSVKSLVRHVSALSDTFAPD